MTDPIVSTRLTSPLLTDQTRKIAGQGEKGAEGSFGKWLEQSLSEVNELQQKADLSAQQLVTGESKDIHGTMIAMQKSSVAFNLVMEVRNKVISAYDEIKRMQF
jgi:flagellar hook-basal body complex protein FliE